MWVFGPVIVLSLLLADSTARAELTTQQVLALDDLALAKKVLGSASFKPAFVVKPRGLSKHITLRSLAFLSHPILSADKSYCKIKRIEVTFKPVNDHFTTHLAPDLIPVIESGFKEYYLFKLIDNNDIMRNCTTDNVSSFFSIPDYYNFEYIRYIIMRVGSFNLKPFCLSDTSSYQCKDANLVKFALSNVAAVRSANGEKRIGICLFIDYSPGGYSSPVFVSVEISNAQYLLHSSNANNIRIIRQALLIH